MSHLVKFISRAVVLTLEDWRKIFGPVLAVGRFRTEEEAIELANNTSYGLGAGLHSSGSPSDNVVDVSSDRAPFISLHSGCKPMYARFICIGVWYCE